MTIVKPVRDWWLGRLRAAGGVGKAIWIGIPFLFACCGLTMCSALISPPAATPTAEVADRSATIEVDETVPTDEPPAATEEPDATERPATATNEPTEAPVRVATLVAATVAASQPSPSTSAPAPTVAQPPTIPPAVPTVAPTQAPLPTATTPAVAAPGDVIISSIFYNGVVVQVESDEYAVITNRGGTAIDIGNWRLNAGEPDQNFTFPPATTGQSHERIAQM